MDMTIHELNLVYHIHICIAPSLLYTDFFLRFCSFGKKTVHCFRHESSWISIYWEGGKETVGVGVIEWSIVGYKSVIPIYFHSHIPLVSTVVMITISLWTGRNQTSLADWAISVMGTSCKCYKYIQNRSRQSKHLRHMWYSVWNAQLYFTLWSECYFIITIFQMCRLFFFSLGHVDYRIACREE